MKVALSVAMLVLLFSSFGCNKAVEEATNKCRTSHKTYAGGTPASNCDLCCRVALQGASADKDGKGTIDQGLDQCTCAMP